MYSVTNSERKVVCCFKHCSIALNKKSVDTFVQEILYTFIGNYQVGLGKKSIHCGETGSTEHHSGNK
jgi:hypothetical protein